MPPTTLHVDSGKPTSATVPPEKDLPVLSCMTSPCAKASVTDSEPGKAGEASVRRFHSLSWEAALHTAFPSRRTSGEAPYPREGLGLC